MYSVSQHFKAIAFYYFMILNAFFKKMIYLKYLTLKLLLLNSKRVEYLVTKILTYTKFKP